MNPSVHSTPIRISSWARGALLVSLGLAIPLTGQSAERALLSGPGISVTTTDVHAEMQSMPVEVQQRLLITPPQLRQLINNIYLRRAAAQESEKSGLVKDAKVQRQLQVARENTLGQAWIARIDENVKPTEQQLEAYARSTYKAEPKRFEIPAETHARHILILGKTPENLASAEKILKELQTGASFEELAKAHSGDPGSAAKGGDLGWFAQGRMVKEFDEGVAALKNPGDLSEIVVSQFGYHIIKLEGRRPTKMKEYGEVREQLHEEAKAKLLKEARTTQIERLQAQAKGDETALEQFIDTEKARFK